MALKTPLFPMEDIFITGFLAQECKIKRLNHKGFTFGKFTYDRSIVHHLNCAAGIWKNNKNRCHSQIIDIESKYSHRLGLEV